MKTLIIKLLILIVMHLSIATSAYAEERRLLLITKPDYKPSPLDKNELRRLFLGIPVYRKGERLIPLVNKSGDLCYQVFLQSILGMSQKRYERVLVSGFYRQGVRSPTVYTSQDNLLLDLKNKKLGISFLFDNDSGEEKNFNVVQEIWVSDTP